MKLKPNKKSLCSNTYQKKQEMVEWTQIQSILGNYSDFFHTFYRNDEENKFSEEMRNPKK